MSILVQDTGFSNDDWSQPIYALGALPANTPNTPYAIDVPSDAEPRDLAEHIDTVAMIRVDFPSFADGRGFTIARQLRDMGYSGRLRARGHVISDQYAMARRSGFDEVEIDHALAERQPEPEWTRRANWQSHDYQSRLRG
ncbi:MAG: DUF934 domain-containing protein [Pseudomonadota bacterium]